MLKKKFLTNVKEKLLSEKSDLLKKSAPPTDIDTDGDETDAIQGHIILDLQLRFAGLNNQKLSSIEEALRRIEDKTYGICVDCEEDILEKRLLANPYYLTCVSCAEERETSSKQRKRL
jgi:RNA polymerase-binding transcription factor DksA